MTFAHWFLIVVAMGVAFTGSVGEKHGNFAPEDRAAQRRHAAMQTYNARKTDKSCYMICQRTDAKGCRRWMTLCRGDSGWPPK